MKKIILSAFILHFVLGSIAQPGAKSENPGLPAENFRKENLIAWCIVPFDAKNRSPEERAEMLVGLGIERVAYDWREKHVPEFEEEILQYRKHGLEYFAFWGYHEKAFELFKKYNMSPQIWKTNPSPKSGTQEEKLSEAADRVIPLAEKAGKIGSQLGLYNHGGWGGEPENLVAMCKLLRSQGYTNVGIVYNFHHAHASIKTFRENLEMMKPYLLCLNLNGMVSSEKVNEVTHENKILPLGSGNYEAGMIRAIIESGYEGPLGILGHIASQDVEISLRNNLDGLEKILNED